MIEQIFNKRYHLEERLGEGGTAIVWSGMDSLLRRRVAIKVLRLQYASDAEFVRRFYHEAESAARLTHPNVVAIYDVGREGETYYIVMELIDGTSLAQRITKEGALSERLTVDLALQICSGLGYAHRQKILHRDIKTANIMLTSDDIVKIADFGIARAVERQTLVMTQQGHFLGSVAYLSPEQAQDHELGPSSDLYSLGVVIYELLTGHLPFSGETPIALALKHLSDAPAPLPLEINPGLASIVMRLLAKDPTARYASAEELASALRSVRDLASQSISRERLANTRTVSAPALTISSPALEIPNPPPRRSPLPDRPEGRGKTRLQHRGWVTPTVIGLALGIAAYVVYRAAIGPLAALHHPPLAVPGVVGVALARAEQTLQSAGLSTRISAQSSETIPAEHVIAEDPAPGAPIASGSTVTLTVSNGYPIVEVPNVVAFSGDDARRLLGEQHFESRIITRYDAKVPKDIVISQQPAPHHSLRTHSSVTLTVSAGVQPVNVPNIVAQNVDNARVQLKKLGLVLNITEQTPSDAIPPGTIASQEPVYGSVAPVGSVVSVVVSAGATMEAVPSLTNLKANDAVNAVQAVGFIPKLSYSVQDGGPEGTVIGQNPGESSSVRHGSIVEMVIAVSGRVPDVSGMSLDTARSTLSNSGYVIGNVEETQEVGDGKVAHTLPAAGTVLRPGESVVIYENLVGPTAPATPN